MGSTSCSHGAETFIPIKHVNTEPLKISNNNFSSSGVSNISIYGGH